MPKISHWLKQITQTQQLLNDNAKDGRDKSLKIGDLVAYPKSGMTYAYNNAPYAEISAMECFLHTHTNKIVCILSFKDKKVQKDSTQVLRLDQ